MDVVLFRFFFLFLFCRRMVRFFRLNFRFSRRCVSVSFCWIVIRSSEFRVFFFFSVLINCRCCSSSWVIYSSYRLVKMVFSEVNVVAFFLSVLSLFLSFIMVFVIMIFSFSYFCLRLVRAISVVDLLVLSTFLSVVICFFLVDNMVLSLIICFCNFKIFEFFESFLRCRDIFMRCFIVRLRYFIWFMIVFDSL